MTQYRKDFNEEMFNSLIFKPYGSLKDMPVSVRPATFMDRQDVKDEKIKGITETIEGLRDESGYLHMTSIEMYVSAMTDEGHIQSSSIYTIRERFFVQIQINRETVKLDPFSGYVPADGARALITEGAIQRQVEESKKPSRQELLRNKMMEEQKDAWLTPYEPRAGDVVRYWRGSGVASTIRSVADDKVHYTNGGWDFVETFVTDPDVVIIRDGKVIKEPADAKQANQKEVDEAVAQQPGANPDARPRVGVSSVPANTPDPYEEHRRKLAEPRPGLRSRWHDVMQRWEGMAGNANAGLIMPVTKADLDKWFALAKETCLAMPFEPPFDDEPPIEQTEDDFGRAFYAENTSTIKDPYVEKPKLTHYADNDAGYGDWQGKK